MTCYLFLIDRELTFEQVDQARMMADLASAPRLLQCNMGIKPPRTFNEIRKIMCSRQIWWPNVLALAPNQVPDQVVTEYEEWRRSCHDVYPGGPARIVIV